MPEAKLERRLLLKVIGAGAGALCGGAVGCGGGDTVAPEEMTKLPKVLSGLINIAVKDFPQLMKVGGGLIGSAEGMADPLAIVRESESQFAVVSGMCTHMRCVLRYNQLNVALECPCHGSSFELDGQVINGPATKALARMTFEFDGQTLGIKVPG